MSKRPSPIKIGCGETVTESQRVPKVENVCLPMLRDRLISCGDLIPAGYFVTVPIKPLSLSRSSFSSREISSLEATSINHQAPGVSYFSSQ
jgi:hypothetical protein